MNKDALKSKAFQRAALQSESYRVGGLLCLLGALMIFVIARGLSTGNRQLLVTQIIVLALVMAHELVMLRAIRRALNTDREVSAEGLVLNILVESQIPTVALFLLMAGLQVSTYQVLVAPAVLLYFLLIILSTLRLRPFLTVLTGLLSALGYLFVTFYTAMRFQDAESQATAFPIRVYYFYAALILTGGILAAVVAVRIRTHVAAALHEAELQNKIEQINHDFDIARSIQQDLLPAQSPGLEEFDLAGWNEPANETGGDYFDWQTLPDGRIAISLADATGHGIGPALVSTLCRAYSRASLLAGAEKNGLLDRLNRLLVDDLSANRFVTFVAVFLDPVSSHVKVFSAGHGPILWYRKGSDKIENLEAQGIPLGMIAGAQYSGASEVQLAPGDMLVLVTDGFYEWENRAGEEFGVSRLESVIRESRDSDAEEVIDRLRTAVENFCGGTEQKDDLTAVVLKRRVSPAASQPAITLKTPLREYSPVT